MKTALGIAVLIGLFLLWRFLVHMWDEWSGAYRRWRCGEPLRASEFQALRWRAIYQGGVWDSVKVIFNIGA
jgi:hypothetical protein